MSPTATASPPFCPSAQPSMEGAVVFGVVGGTASEPRVGYLTQPLPVTPAAPLEVMNKIPMIATIFSHDKWILKACARNKIAIDK